MGRADLAGSARLELVSGVAQLRPEDAMLEAMLSGWRAQQAARGLLEDTVADRERLVRRFGEFAGEYPWAWSPGHVDEWSLHLTAEEHLAPSTIRAYQGTLRQFTEFLVDGRYGWAAACEEAFGPGRHPVAVCHEWNTIAHLNDYEGSPEARPFTREEMQRFLDYADEQVERAVRSGRKGALAAYRDATIFKVIYGWGLRRTETSRLDEADFGRNPRAPHHPDHPARPAPGRPHPPPSRQPPGRPARPARRPRRRARGRPPPAGQQPARHPFPLALPRTLAREGTDRGRARPAAARPRDQPAPGPQHRPVHPGRRGPRRHPGQDTRHPRPGRDPVAEDLRRGLGRLRRRHQRPGR